MSENTKIVVMAVRRQRRVIRSRMSTHNCDYCNRRGNRNRDSSTGSNQVDSKKATVWQDGSSR